MKFVALLFFIIFLNLPTDAAVPRCIHSTKGDKLDKFLNEIYFDSTGRPRNDAIKVSDNGRFNIHYLISGENAPDNVDKDQNGHPDFVDSAAYYFEYVYDIEVNQIGFLSPIPEPGGGSDAYDVYLWNLGGDLQTYGQTVPTEEFLPRKTWQRYYSFIMIDNNFSPQDSSMGLSGRVQTYYTFGYEALKVTIAHEFHHAIQNMYGVDNNTALTFMESTSTFFEHFVFPEVGDYIQYVKQLFKSPDRMPFGYRSSSDLLGPYSYSLFMIFLEEKHDINLIRKIWEYILAGNNNFYALNLALADYNTNLDAEWCDFRKWCYYTDYRAIEGQYFQNAESYPAIKFYKDEVFAGPSVSSSSFLESYEMRYYRYIFQNGGELSDDTLVVMMGSFDIESARFNAGINVPYQLAIANQEMPNSKKLDDLPLYFFLEADDDEFCYDMLLNRGSVSVNIAYAYPNPYKTNSGHKLFFPAPENAKLYDEVYLSIYTSDMTPLYQETLQVSANNNKLVVPLDNLPESIKSGTHIFSVKLNDEFLIGKLAVIRE